MAEPGCRLFRWLEESRARRRGAIPLRHSPYDCCPRHSGASRSSGLTRRNYCPTTTSPKWLESAVCRPRRRGTGAAVVGIDNYVYLTDADAARTERVAKVMMQVKNLELSALRHACDGY